MSRTNTASTHNADDDPDPNHRHHERSSAPSAEQPEHNRAHRTKTFSLAGQPAYDPPPYCQRTDSYISPEYVSYHEQYEHERKPVWGLAAPLPRIVRPGMRPRRASDAQTHHEGLPTINNIRNGVRHVQSNVSRRPSTQRLPLQRVASRAPEQAQSFQQARKSDDLPNYQTFASGAEDQRDSGDQGDAGPEQTHASAEAIGKHTTANSWRRSSDITIVPEEQTDADQNSGQVKQQISNHTSHDFAADDCSDAQPLPRPKLASIQEIPRPSLIDKPEIEALRKRLQAQPDFVPHHTHELARPPTEIDLDARLPPHHKSEPIYNIRSKTSTNASQHLDKAEGQSEYLNTWSHFRYRVREPLSEFLSVYTLMTLGFSANLLYRISNLTPSPSPMISTPYYADVHTTNLVWSLATMAAVYIAGGVSGAHISPVVTLTLTIFRGFPPRLVLRYLAAQFLGCLFGCMTAYALYRDALHITAANAGVDLYEALIADTSALHTVPHTEVSAATIFFSQFVMLALLTVVVLALGDDQNSPPGAGMNALVLGLVVYVFAGVFAFNAGGSFSPFRDLAPRVVVSVVWRRGDVWWERSVYWLWGACIAPLLGGLTGAMLYDLCVFTGGESPVNYPDWGEKVSRWGQHMKVSCRRKTVIDVEAGKDDHDGDHWV